MKRTRQTIICAIFLTLFVLGGLACEDDPVPPDTINSGSGSLDSAGNTVATFNTDIGQFNGFVLSISNDLPVIAAVSGLVITESLTAPDPGDYPKGLYPLAQEIDPPLGAHYYMFVDVDNSDGGGRYFVRFSITAKDIEPENNRVTLNYDWEFNTESDNRNF